MKGALAVVLGIQAVSIAAMILAPDLSRGLVVAFGILTMALIVFQIFRKPRVDEVVEEKVAERTEKLVELMSHYEQQAMTDALTGLLNRRGGEDSIQAHVSRSLRIRSAISFILVDIDHFKKVNDEHGHATGDVVITGIARAIRDNLRKADFAIRWGGEEFLLCLPDTDLSGAVLVAEKLRAVVEKIDFGIQPVTISLGCAELGQDPFNIALARADMHLYFAKSKGRNQVFPNSLHKILDAQ